MDIVERLRGMVGVYIGDADIDDDLNSAADEIERLREALREIYEVYAGSEGIPKPMTAVECYLLSLFMEVVKIAQEALKEKA